MPLSRRPPSLPCTFIPSAPLLLRARPRPSLSLRPPPRSSSTPQNPQKPTSPSVPLRPLRPLRTLWAFSRPHTIYGSAISVLSMTALAGLQSHRLLLALATLRWTLAPALLLNVFIVGLNQLTDVPLDAVNKPYLPLPSGALTERDGWMIVAAALAGGMAFCVAPAATPVLRVVLVGSAVLGAAYSAPPVRLKRFALLASLCILCVRGLLVNACFYLYAVGWGGGLVGGVAALPVLVQFACAFFVAFGLVIALLKDVPDIRGDRLFRIRTFSVRLGGSLVFRAAHCMLGFMYAAAAVVTACLATGLVGKVFAGVAHVLVGAWLLWKAKDVDAEDGKAVYAHYMDVWKAFYLEYLLLPLTAL